VPRVKNIKTSLYTTADSTHFLFTRLTVMSIQLSETHKHMAYSQEKLLWLGGGRDWKWGESKEDVGSREDHLK